MDFRQNKASKQHIIIIDIKEFGRSACMDNKRTGFKRAVNIRNLEIDQNQKMEKS